MLKKIVISFIFIISMLVIWQWPLLIYGIQQGKGQLNVIIKAKPIKYFLEDENFPDSLKAKLIIAQKARTFAIQKLGLKNSDNYTKMYNQKGEVLLWNLSACAPYQLQPYQWSFPFLGEMPYKGFFDLDEAKQEQAKLDTLGYDTRIRPVGGWSTLGILNDPILSNMLQRSDGALAEVIIHELTHSTIFIKNNIEFNENLASFIGEQGAQAFLAKEFKQSPEKLESYIASEKDGRMFRQHMLIGTDSLNLLYLKMDDTLANKTKSRLKGALIQKIVNQLDTVPFTNLRYKKIFDKQLPNNAYFMSLKRYHSQKDTLNELYTAYNQDIKKMIEGLKEKYSE
ncbi:MAG: aminopeptidase [Cyclobacteriaceae bacterium]